MKLIAIALSLVGVFFLGLGTYTAVTEPRQSPTATSETVRGPQTEQHLFTDGEVRNLVLSLREPDSIQVPMGWIKWAIGGLATLMGAGIIAGGRGVAHLWEQAWERHDNDMDIIREDHKKLGEKVDRHFEGIMNAVVNLQK